MSNKRLSPQGDDVLLSKVKCVLMGHIDDATGRVYGRFYAYEGSIPAMGSLRQYIRKYGIPLGIYLDKHTTSYSLEMV